MTIEIGGSPLPPVYPTQPPSDPGSGEGTPPDSSEASSGSGGPDAVYEPGAPEDGEPLTYSFPQGTTPSETGEDGTGEAAPEGVEGTGDGGADPYADGASGNGATDPYADASSGDGSEASSEDVGASGDGTGDPYSDYGATDGGDGSFDYGAHGDGTDDPAVEGGSEDGGVDPYAEQGAGDGGDGSEGYGDYSDYGDGSTDPSAEGAQDDGSVDPEAGLPEDGNTSETGQVGEDEEQAPVAAPPQPAVQDHISAAAHRDAVAQASAAAEAARPSLSAALGQSHAHGSLALQVGQASEAGSSAPVQPRAVRQVVRQPAAQQAGKLLAAVQDAATQTQAETPKVRASVMAQAAYAMIGDAHRLDRSMLSLIDKFG